MVSPVRLDPDASSRKQLCMADVLDIQVGCEGCHTGNIYLLKVWTVRHAEVRDTCSSVINKCSRLTL